MMDRQSQSKSAATRVTTGGRKGGGGGGELEIKLPQITPNNRLSYVIYISIIYISLVGLTS